ncbi:MAG: radical SAM protein, partial [bacterium]
PMRILLVTPPMVQVNAPYPATAYLTGILRKSGHIAVQSDASLILALRLFSRAGILAIRTAVKHRKRPASVAHFLRHSRDYADTVEAVIHFLQGHNPTLALRIVSRSYLPEGPRFAALENLDPHARLGNRLSTHDTAIHLASLYLDDLVDAIREGVDSRFELARYGEQLAANAHSFDAIAEALERNPTLVGRLIDEIALELLRQHTPDLIGFTLPFPGNVYGALRMARAIKRHSPHTPIVMGGGYANTELRSLSDPRFFDYTDYLTLDDGERPLLRILSHVDRRNAPLLTLMDGPDKHSEPPALERSFIRKNYRVCFIPSSSTHPSTANQLSSCPDFTGLPLNQYFSLIEFPNPMHRIWSCGRWNKMMLAHGCYWHRCAFCDTQL